MIRMVDVISKKRDGYKLTRDEIEFVVRGTADGSLPDYQLSAFLMAAYLRGLSNEETLLLTNAMAYFGDVVDLSSFGGTTVDKHSTGGVGDKTTLVVAPTAAACGATVAKMSGRALGHTGGTLDKLEAIPGFNCALSNEEFINQVNKTGIAVISQTASLAPADKRLYALRDVTATVSSLPLIAASIMSKKLAAGAKNIVLDVKCGKGAFMEKREDALELARLMVEFGNSSGRSTAAFITDMNEPLGYAIGNSLEVEEAVRVLKGEKTPRFYELCVRLSGAMISLAADIPYDDACERAEKAIESGRSLDKFKEMVIAQGGDAQRAIDINLTGNTKATYILTAPQSGYVEALNALECGEAAMLTGAGRLKKESSIDLTAGILLNKKTGDYVNKGDVLATLYYDESNKDADINGAIKRLKEAYTFSQEPCNPSPIIIDKTGI